MPLSDFTCFSYYILSSCLVMFIFCCSSKKWWKGKTQQSSCYRNRWVSVSVRQKLAWITSSWNVWYAWFVVMSVYFWALEDIMPSQWHKCLPSFLACNFNMSTRWQEILQKKWRSSIGCSNDGDCQLHIWGIVFFFFFFFFSIFSKEKDESKKSMNITHQETLYKDFGKVPVSPSMHWWLSP